jgi:hypothetical protein
MPGQSFLPMPKLLPLTRTVFFSKLFMVGLNVSIAEYFGKVNGGSVVDEWMDDAPGKSDPSLSTA